MKFTDDVEKMFKEISSIVKTNGGSFTQLEMKDLQESMKKNNSSEAIISIFINKISTNVLKEFTLYTKKRIQSKYMNSKGMNFYAILKTAIEKGEFKDRLNEREKDQDREKIDLDIFDIEYDEKTLDYNEI